ncbi:UNVERIFIED_CONTAM: hypothetical protein RMT77_009637 [Armadillidium vulgare]
MNKVNNLSLYTIICLIFILSSNGFYYNDNNEYNISEAYQEHKEVELNGSPSQNEYLRTKREIIIAFPQESYCVSDFYINLPLPHLRGVFTPLSLQGKITFDLPNITFSQGKSLTDRLSIYGAVESLFSHFGFNGRSCVLRAICESNEYSIIVDGIVAEIVTLILELTWSFGDATSQEYFEAKEYGRIYGDCESRFWECTISLFKWTKLLTQS